MQTTLSPGPYVVFASAVWNLHPAVQIVLMLLAFNYHSTDTDNQVATATHVSGKLSGL